MTCASISKRSYRQATVGMLVVMLFTTVISACGSTSSPTVDCHPRQLELRYWERGVVAVTLSAGTVTPATPTPAAAAQKPEIGVLPTVTPTPYVSPTSTPSPVGKDIDLPSDKTINDTVKSSISALVDKGVELHDGIDGKAPFVARAGNNATAFFQIRQTQDRAQQPQQAECDGAVQDLVNSVNGKGPIYGTFPNKTPFAIQGASPDWLGMGMMGDNTTGVPGGPAENPNPPLTPQDMAFSLPAGSPQPTGDGTGTTVVVLDTGYSMGNTSHQSYAQCGSDKHLCVPKVVPISRILPVSDNSSRVTDTGIAYTGATNEATQSSAFQSLASAKVLEESDLQLQTDQLPDRGQMNPPYPKDMPLYPPYAQADGSGEPIKEVDHGLFISSIIHGIAPKAQIRLVRVLNDYGVGDVSALLIALQTIILNRSQLDIDPGSKIIVNMSLRVGPPLECAANFWNTWQALEQLAQQKAGGAMNMNPYQPSCDVPIFRGDPGEIPSEQEVKDAGAIQLPILTAISSFSQAQIEFFIAAGNHPADENRYWPDLPGALCKVHTVEAFQYPVLNQNGAPFSNGSSGGYFACLDGLGKIIASFDVSSILSQNQVAVGQNVCGIYMQPISGHTPSSAIALWSGTSFSTAVASGSYSVGTPGVNIPNEPVTIYTWQQPCNQRS